MLYLDYLQFECFHLCSGVNRAFGYERFTLPLSESQIDLIALRNDFLEQREDLERFLRQSYSDSELLKKLVKHFDLIDVYWSNRCEAFMLVDEFIEISHNVDQWRFLNLISLDNDTRQAFLNRPERDSAYRDFVKLMRSALEFESLNTFQDRRTLTELTDLLDRLEVICLWNEARSSAPIKNL